MSLPAFSAIIANYVPNHGNLGPSGSYNAWVNKINTRKNACNSWATCTNTPDDIWDEKFFECDEGCSAQGDDKCVSNFCDALADVYDYTRRLEEEDVAPTRQLEDEAPDWCNKVQQLQPNRTVQKPLNEWMYRLRLQQRCGLIDYSTLSTEWGACSNGCLSQEGTVCARTLMNRNYRDYCVAMLEVVADGEPMHDACEPDAPDESQADIELAYSDSVGDVMPKRVTPMHPRPREEECGRRL